MWSDRTTCVHDCMNTELTQLTKLVLDRGYLMSLGIVDEQGPWVADVIYIFDDDFNLYWMSQPTRRHSQAIDSGSNRVAVAIAVTQGPEQPDEGLQISGTAQRIDVRDSSLLKLWMNKKQKEYLPEMGTVLDEHVWYKLTPDCIELIYQEKFDYNRQKVK